MSDPTHPDPETSRRSPTRADDEPAVGERRAFLGAVGSLIGTSVGVSMLAGCLDPDGADPTPPPGPSPTDPVALIGTTPVKWVDTVSIDLHQTAGCVQSEVVIARGYAAANDGGGGVFSWDGTATTGDDGGTIIVATTTCSGAPLGRWIRLYSGALDVRWFGARAGSASLAAQNDLAIQRAIAVATPVGGIDAGRIYFPQGQWYIATSITIIKDDSVILCGPGGAGLWGATGAYDHYSAKLLWCGGAGTMVDFASTMRCGVVGLMLDGGGTATCGLRQRTTDAPAKGNCFEDVVIRNLAAVNSIGFHIGTGEGTPTYVNPDVAFNKLSRFWIIGGAIGILQEGNQTVSTVYEDGVLTAQTSYGMKLLGGDINVSRCFFGADAVATAEVYVGVKAQYARFAGNTHETVCLTSYRFEPTTASALRPFATLFLGVRVLYQRSTDSPRRILDFQQDGHLTLLGCTFDGYVAANAPEVYLAPPVMGYADTGLINDIGCRYLNGARAVVAPVAGAYQSFFSNGSPTTPPFTTYMGEHLSSGARHRLHNSCLELQDNYPGLPQQPGVRLSTRFGSLKLSSVTPRPPAEILLRLENDLDDPCVTINGAGGPRFYHQGTEAAPTSRPTITGSRGGNVALANLLTALASFGLITNSTTP